MKRLAIILILILSFSGVTIPLVYTKNEVRISRRRSAHEANRRREAIRREIAREILRGRRGGHHGGHGGGCFIDSLTREGKWSTG